jgi:hypothetical protein
MWAWCIGCNPPISLPVLLPHALTTQSFVVNGVTYQYMWQIVAYDETADLMPLTHDSYCIVDAVTGEVLPIPAS